MEALREIIFEDEMETEVNSGRDQQYQRSNMQRSAIMNRLRQAGCRITKQRKIILDIILQEECTCCKEIYFLASKRDPNIGMATIYRMINLLEEIGALKRKRAYRICNEESPVHICSVKLDDYTSIRLDGEKLRQVIEKGMESFGYLHDRRVRSISMESGE
jgi:Fur family transcriptional regulator, ferric uptake regulator